MATYGDRYVFTFETTGQAATLRNLAAIEKQARSSAAAILELASAYQTLRSSQNIGGAGTISTNLRNVQIINNQSGGNVIGNNVASPHDNTSTRITTRSTSQTSGSSSGGGGNDGFGGLGTRLQRYAMFWVEGFAIYQAVQMIQQAIQSWANSQQQMDQFMAQFRVSMQAGSREAREYASALLDISKSTGISFTEIGAGLIVQERVQGAPKDLALRAAQVQRLTGADNLAAERDLLSLSKQFPGRELTSILDSFTGAMKRSSLQADEFFDLLESSGPLSKQFNTSMEVIFGAFAGLSTVTGESGQSLELFMRQMERIYTEASTRSVVEKYIGPVGKVDVKTGYEIRRPFEDIMGGIAGLSPQAQQEIATTIPNMLGQQTRQLFLQMVHNWGSIESAIQGAQNAQGQFVRDVNTMMDTWITKTEKAGAAWENLMAVLGNSEGPKKILDWWTSFLNDQAEAIKNQQDLDRMMEEVAKSQGTTPMMLEQQLKGQFTATYPERTGMYFSGAEGDPMYIQYLRSELYRLSGEMFRQVRVPPVDYSWATRAPTGPGLSQAWRGYSGPLGLPPENVSQLTMPQGVSPSAAMDQYFRRLGEILSSYRQMAPEAQGMTDQTLMNYLGITPETILMVQSTGEAITTTTADTAILGQVVKEMGENAKDAAKSISIGSMKTDLEFGTPRTDELMSEALGTYAYRVSKRMELAKEEFGSQAPTDTAALKEAAGINEQRVFVLSKEGDIIRTLIVDTAIFAQELSNVSAAMRGISVGYEAPPEWMSESEYFSKYQRYSAEFISWQGKYGAETDISSEYKIGPSGSLYAVSATPESDAYARAKLSEETRNYNELIAQGERQNAILEKIRGSLSGFVGSLLQPTPVTEEQMARSKLGTYGDQWDEPVRKIRAAVDYRKSMRGGDNRWAGFAAEMGVDLSSIESAIASGAEFERKFYSGQMGPEFYDKYSKEGFITSAKEKLGEMEGRKNLEAQAMGWLKEAGITGDVAKMYASEFAGTSSPIEMYLRGGKTDDQLGKDLQPTGKAAAGGIMDGVVESAKDKAPVKTFLEAWQIDKDEQKTALVNFGKAMGGPIIDGIVDSAAGGKLIGRIKDAVIAELTNGE